jgi:hypothetical protein
MARSHLALEMHYQDTSRRRLNLDREDDTMVKRVKKEKLLAGKKLEKKIPLNRP